LCFAPIRTDLELSSEMLLTSPPPSPPPHTHTHTHTQTFGSGWSRLRLCSAPKAGAKRAPHQQPGGQGRSSPRAVCIYSPTRTRNYAFMHPRTYATTIPVPAVLLTRMLSTDTIMGIPKNLVYMVGLYVFFNYVLK
jgi:hypothetical protein